jgi:hypothetical protein
VEWLTVVPSVLDIEVGSSASLGVTFDAGDLADGDYGATLRLLNNDLETPAIDLPVTLHVGSIEAGFHVNLTCARDDDDDDGGGDDDAPKGPSNGDDGDDDDDGGDDDDENDDEDDDGPARRIRGLITLPVGYSASDIVVSSIRAAGSVPVDTTEMPAVLGQTLTVWFDRVALLAALPDGDAVPVTVIGEIDGQTWFHGTATACIHRPTMVGVGGDYPAGSRIALSWNDPPGTTATAFDVWFSADAGETWNPVVLGTTNHTTMWTVPVQVTDQALLGLVAFGGLGPIGSWRSPTFRIVPATADALAVRGLPSALSLRLVGPNPSRNGAALELALPQRGSVAVSVYDVRGARVRQIEAREFEPGWHAVAWDGRGDDGRPLGAGIYFVRAEAGGRRVAVRVALLK